MGNSESRNKHSEENKETTNKSNHNQWHDAVNGNTEQLLVSSPKKPHELNHAVFETTSENANFTVSEHLQSVPVNTTRSKIHENVSHPAPKDNTELIGGLFNKISNLLVDTEVAPQLSELSDNIYLNKIRSLLQETETAPQLGGSSVDNFQLDKIRELLQETETNNLVGGSNDNFINENPMINKLRELLLQETESNIINFKGGALNKENLFSEKESDKSNSEHQKVEKRELTDDNQDLKTTDQSGGEELDTELKGILLELQSNNKNLNKHIGGKSSRKSSKKSRSKKQSRRTSESSRASGASGNTYNIGDSDESDGEDYLSTSSMNTSDINIKHYRS